ncbi:thioredoxin-like protein [Cladorrhinum sp. PSN259]|nr:thioredoxin-like protein [Cladorrhinum sp. PSN259]
MANTKTSTSSQPFTFTIQVISDTVCPWCYIGKKTLDAAMASYAARHPGGATFNLTWSPFMLYPRAPEKGISKHRLLSTVYGPHGAPQILSRLTVLGSQPSVDINFSWRGTTGNSRNSHRLILLCSADKKKQSELIDALFDYNFQRGLDISDPLVLAKIGYELKLFDSEAAGLSWLIEGDEKTNQVNSESEKAKNSMGMVAAPSYLVNGRWQVGGMQESSTWEDVFERVRRESSSSQI